jgi:hypothetical protein
VAFTKDQWTRATKQPDGSIKRERNERRWGRGKRWLAVWLDPSGKEVSKAFSSKAQADKYGSEMETDIGRGEYVAPRAGSVRFKVVLERWLRSRSVDPATWITYERALRLHVLPTFGERETGAIRPSEIGGWLVGLETRVGTGTARTAFTVLHGSLGLPSTTV